MKVNLCGASQDIGLSLSGKLGQAGFLGPRRLKLRPFCQRMSGYREREHGPRFPGSWGPGGSCGAQGQALSLECPGFQSSRLHLLSMGPWARHSASLSPGFICINVDNNCVSCRLAQVGLNTADLLLLAVGNMQDSEKPESGWQPSCATFWQPW